MRHSRPGRPRVGKVSGRESEGASRGTHDLDSRGWAKSAAEKVRGRAEALTPWTAEGGQSQRQRKRGGKQRHSRPGQPRVDKVSRRESEGASRGTHVLDSQGWAKSVAEK